MKRLLAGAAVLIAVLGLWLWRATRLPHEEPVAPATAASGEPDEKGPLTSLASPEVAAGDARVTRAADDSSGAVGVSADHAEPGELEVRVLLGPDGAPACGAEVFLLDEERVDPGARRAIGYWGTIDVDLELEAFALRALADVEGRAVLPTPLGSSKLAARFGDGYASRMLAGAEPGPIVLELTPDPSVRVSVVDQDGRPVAGVPVALCSATNHQDEDCLRASTEPGGIAELRARGHGARLRTSGGPRGPRNPAARAGRGAHRSRATSGRTDRAPPSGDGQCRGGARRCAG